MMRWYHFIMVDVDDGVLWYSQQSKRWVLDHHTRPDPRRISFASRKKAVSFCSQNSINMRNGADDRVVVAAVREAVAEAGRHVSFRARLASSYTRSSSESG